MIPGMAEASAGIKAGSSVIHAIDQASSLPQWPNMHESLIALHAILDEWCVMASGTTKLIKHEQTRRRRSRFRVVHGDGIVVWGGNNVIAGGAYVFVARSDMESLLTPKAQLVKRWSKVERRAAARRGLRSLLAVYFPGLLVNFIDAVEGRAEFVSKNRGLPETISSLSDLELADVAQTAEDTRRALVEVTDRLADLIVKTFPLDPTV